MAVDFLDSVTYHVWKSAVNCHYIVLVEAYDIFPILSISGFVPDVECGLHESLSAARIKVLAGSLCTEGERLCLYYFMNGRSSRKIRHIVVLLQTHVESLHVIA